MSNYRQLAVWNKAHVLTLQIYKLTVQFPDGERFGLTSQMRRAAAAIGANLAEGSGRRSDGEFARFVDIARGSSDELDYHLLLARDLGLMDAPAYERVRSLNAEVGRMLTGLVDRIRHTKAARAGQQ